jgi:hypothetical protein
LNSAASSKSQVDLSFQRNLKLPIKQLTQMHPSK